MSLKDWSLTPGDNASAPGIDWAEGQPPGTVNDSARQMMADIRRSWEQLELATWGGTSTGAANAYEITPVIGITVVAPVYTAGAMYAFISHQANTGAATLNVSAVGATAIQSAGAALTGGEIPSGQVIAVIYDGTAFQLIGPQAQLRLIDTQVFNAGAAQTWTKPAGAGIVRAVGCGGGGKGGDLTGSTNPLAAGGGGGGDSAIIERNADTLGATETVNVGAGGTATGQAGGQTDFGAILTAIGGNAGGPAPAGAAIRSAPGSSSGTSIGDIVIKGGVGVYGDADAQWGNWANGGGGGNSLYGGGGARPTATQAAQQVGQAARGYGGGGGGACSFSTSTPTAGGDGFDGVLFVFTYGY